MSSTDTFKGTIEIQLGALYKEYIGRSDGVPQFKLTLGDKDEFAKKVVTFDSLPFFDQPTAARTLVGFVRSLNELAAQEAGSAFIDIKEDGVEYMINCDDDEVRETSETTMKSDNVAFSFNKNVMNAFFPLRFEFTW
jgi:hypothetical protein